MKKKTHSIYPVIALIVGLLGCNANGQQIVSLNIDTLMCLGQTQVITIGNDTLRSVRVKEGMASMSKPERAFLPDGVSCSPYGCSYRSTVTFQDFPANLTVSSVQDIKFVRLNIEHSYLADLYIGLTCPNGQRVSLMNYSNRGSSSCTSSIPWSAIGWGTNTVSQGTDLGQPINTVDGSHPCDSTTTLNRPGIGWNYCWSNNTTSGYQYAHVGESDDGVIYRNGHRQSGGTAIDSSNVAAGTQFYHPSQNFSALIGCPLNGNWYIEVMDGWSGDNGYVFDWELALDPSLIPYGGMVDHKGLYGSQVTRLNDSAFVIAPPVGAEGDTTVTYLVRLTNTEGHYIDTTFRVHYYSDFVLDVDEDHCVGDTIMAGGVAVVRDTAWRVTTTTLSGCDSTVSYTFRFHPVYDTADTARFCRNQPFIYGGVQYGGPMDFVNNLLTGNGCDSIVHVSLQPVDASFFVGMLVSDDSLHWSADTVLLGCEPFKVYFRDTTRAEAWRTWTLGDGDTSSERVFSHLYAEGVYDLRFEAGSVGGCVDSVLRPQSIAVFANPQAEFDWYEKPPAAHNPEVQFSNFSHPAGLDYEWHIGTDANGGAYDSITEAEPFYHWGEEGQDMSGDYVVDLLAHWRHSVTLHDSLYTHTCTDTAEHVVTIMNDYLQFPTLVTPNGDGINDTWEVVNLVDQGVYSMNEVWIYNAWGVLVYHGKNIHRHEDFWDPAKRPDPDGTYFFHFTARSQYGIVKYNGSIEVLRGE